MTPELRQSNVIMLSLKCGAPGAIRTPDPQIRRPRALLQFIIIFRMLLLIMDSKSIVDFWGSFRLRSIVCQNYARVKIPIDFAVIILQYIYMKITTTHKKLLAEIRKNPNSTLAEYGAAIGVSAPATVDYHMRTLIINGLVRKGNKWEIIEDNQTRTSGKL